MEWGGIGDFFRSSLDPTNLTKDTLLTGMPAPGVFTVADAIKKEGAEDEANAASAEASRKRTEAEWAKLGLVNPKQTDATGIASQLLRSQFNEYEKSFKPIELATMNQLSFNNPKILPEAVSKATSAATGQAGTMRGVLDRSNAAMGIAPTDQQARVSDRILNLDRSTAVAGAANKARGNVRTQDEMILLGGTPNMNVVKNPVQ